VGDFALESKIRRIKTVEPGVAGDFIPALSPDALLFVESRLIGRQVLEVDPCMMLKEDPDLFAFVPSGAVHIEMDGIASERSEHMLEHGKESFAVTLGGAYESLPSQERRNPSGEVEPLSVLAGSGDFETSAFLGPTSSKARMETESSFVLKDDRFIDFEAAEFFLTHLENRRRLWPEPEDKHSQPVSDCNPGDAASIGTAVPSGARPSSSGESPALARPRRLAVSQNRGASFPGPFVVAPSLRLSVAPDGLTAAGEPEPVSHPGLHHVSSAPESHDLDPTKRLPVPDAGPPKPATWRQSSIPPMRPELASPVQEAAPWSPRGESKSKLSQFKYNIIMQHLILR
jgi:hypothetical protein